MFGGGATGVGASQPGGAPGAAPPSNPNAPIIFLVPTKGLGMNGMPRLIKLPTMYSLDAFAATVVGVMSRSPQTGREFL